MGNRAAGLVCRYWRVPVWDHSRADGPRRVLVLLRHNTVTGHRCVLVDGREHWSSSDFFDRGDILDIQLGAHACQLRIIPEQRGFRYELSLDGDILTDAVSSPSSRSSLSGASQRALSLSIDSDSDAGSDGLQSPLSNSPAYPPPVFFSGRDRISCDPVMLAVTSYSIERVDSKLIAYYTITVSSAAGSHSVRRRFHEFVTLHSRLSAAFHSSQDSESPALSLPARPPRRPKLLVDHCSPAFLEARVAQLHRYLRALAACPLVLDNPDMQEFIARTHASADTEERYHTRHSRTSHRSSPITLAAEPQLPVLVSRRSLRDSSHS